MSPAAFRFAAAPGCVVASLSHFISRMTGLGARHGSLRPSMVIALPGLLTPPGHSEEARIRREVPAETLLAPIPGLGAFLPVAVGQHSAETRGEPSAV